MFGRGNWAVFGVKPGSLDKFKKSINDAVVLFGVSQLAASAQTKIDQQPTTGINGFANPRQDEEIVTKLGPNAHDLQVKIFDHVTATPEAQAENPFDYSKVEGFYADQPAAFKFGTETVISGEYYGFWMVFNTMEDVDDMASKREQIAYSVVEKPYKLLNKDEKKGVEQQVRTKTVTTRKQFPVLVDFTEGKGYALTTNVEEVGAVREMLTSLGADTYSVCWRFGQYDWPTNFLNTVYKDTKFREEMQTRADELSRFRSDEVEPLDDKMTERIVNTFFAISELETA